MLSLSEDIRILLKGFGGKVSRVTLPAAWYSSRPCW